MSSIKMNMIIYSVNRKVDAKKIKGKFYKRGA